MVNVRTRKERRSRGAAAAEAALIMPLLLLVTFGAIKYGWLFLKAQQITNAARHGARMRILPDMTDNEVMASVTNLLNAANIPLDGGDITITPVNLPALDRTAYNVSITIPSENVDVLNISLFPPVGDLISSVTMAKEGLSEPL
jgi:Flp pilus assembly protein TadG